jgi:hypothetical protein
MTIDLNDGLEMKKAYFNRDNKKNEVYLTSLSGCKIKGSTQNFIQPSSYDSRSLDIAIDNLDKFAKENNFKIVEE